MTMENTKTFLVEVKKGDEIKGYEKFPFHPKPFLSYLEDPNSHIDYASSLCQGRRRYVSLSNRKKEELRTVPGRTERHGKSL